jgi:putative aldouronate transport system substrate-binding protein
MPSWLAAKALVPLDDLISQYGPNLQQHYGTMIDRLKFSTQYPNIYGFGTGSSTTASYEPGNYWQICFMVQEGALKAQGYPTIKTPTDFENVLKTDLANNPTTPDGLKKVGLDLVTSDGWRYGMSLVQPAFDTAGLPGGSIGRIYLDPTTNQLVFGTIQPVFQTYMQWLNKLYNEGLIDPQSFTQTYDDYIAEMSSGQCVGCIDGYWEMYQADVALKTGKYPSESYMEFPVLTDPSSMTWCEDQPGNPLGEGGISVSSSCKNPAKIVNFMDFMVSEPGQILRWWGVEGTDYTVDANNQRVQSTADATAYNSNMIGFEQTSGVQLYTNDGGEWLDNPYGWTTSNGQDLIVTSNLSSAYTQDDIDCMTAYGVKNYCEYFPDPSKQGNQPYGSISALPSGLTDDTKADNTNLGNDELQYYTNMITCTPDQFSTQWQAWVTQAQNDGCQALLDEANTALQDRIQLWGLTPQSN